MFGKVKNLIHILIFMVLIAGPIVTWGFLLKIDEVNRNLTNNQLSIMDVLDFDLNEKRLKATLSETTNLATITTELENYFNDRAPYRSILITLKKNIDGRLEEPYKNGLESILLKTFGRKKKVETAELYTDTQDGRVLKCFDQAVDLYNNHALARNEIDPYDDTMFYPLKTSENGKVIIGQSNWFYLNDTNIKYYTGENSTSKYFNVEEHVKPYIRLNELCKKVGKKLIIHICPEKEEIYPEYMPTLEKIDEIERPLKIRDYIKENTDITYIYPKEDILSKKSNYQLYKKYDSHWNYLGAYLALNKIKEAMGLSTIPLYDLGLEKTIEETCDLAYFGGIPSDTLKPSMDYIITDYKASNNFEKTWIKQDFSSEAFMSTCDKGENRKVLLIGDSYREAMVPFATRDFKEFYCTSFMNTTAPFVKEQAKRVDTIVILLVERNETETLNNIIELLYRYLKEYENEYDKVAKKTNTES